MCGVVGVVTTVGSEALAQRAITALLLESETRGSEAAGVAVLDTCGILVAKDATSPRKFVRSSSYVGAFDARSAGFLGAIGHTRLVTNGSAIYGDNNQPVVADGVAMVHNGIVVNSRQMWRAVGVETPPVEVDSAALLALIIDLAATCGGIAGGVAAAFGELNGSASVALLSEGEGTLTIATNTGSIYLAFDGEGRFIAFASEAPILQRFRTRKIAAELPPIASVRQLPPGRMVSVDCATGMVEWGDLSPYVLAEGDHPSTALRVVPDEGSPDLPAPEEGRFRRCVRCVLPETFPFIEFDGDGVCSQCRSYEPVSIRPEAELEDVLAKYRKGNGEPDCILAFSGGRDSAYGLHRLVNDFGMRPLTLTYDWGMVTDLARRNQARLVGQLGIEQILISANIAKKRKNIQRNMKAWLARPELGMVPLLMAGDKQFFTHSARLAKQSRVAIVVFCVNPLETTYFKSGFAGIDGQRYYDSGLLNKLRMVRYYGTQFLRNPRYLNRSLMDTASAFRASYFTKHDYVQLFEHLRWDEDEINATLIDTYHWETDPSTPTTWRIGDGTAAFYNWVYYSAVGFTEYDTFRSNQVREGVITRARALELVNAENQPRWDRLAEYFELIELPLDDAQRAVAGLVQRLDVERSRRRANR